MLKIRKLSNWFFLEQNTRTTTNEMENGKKFWTFFRIISVCRTWRNSGSRLEKPLLGIGEISGTPFQKKRRKHKDDQVSNVSFSKIQIVKYIKYSWILPISYAIKNSKIWPLENDEIHFRRLDDIVTAITSAYFLIFGSTSNNM